MLFYVKIKSNRANFDYISVLAKLNTFDVKNDQYDSFGGLVETIGMEIGMVWATVNLSIDATLHLDNAGNTSITDFSIWTCNSDGSGSWINCLSRILTSETLFSTVNKIELIWRFCHNDNYLFIYCY